MACFTKEGDPSFTKPSPNFKLGLISLVKCLTLVALNSFQQPCFNFQSFLNTELGHVVNILPRGRQRHVTSHEIDYFHYNDVIMGTIASQITSLTIVYSIVYSDADQRKHQSPASLAFVRGIHRGPVNSLHKWPVTRKMFPFDDVIMIRNTPVAASDAISFLSTSFDTSVQLYRSLLYKD